MGLSRVSSLAQIKISRLLETIVWQHFDLKMSFNTRYKTLPYIISSKLNFDETSINTDYTKLTKLKFIMHVPMIVKYIFYMVTKNAFILSAKNILAFKLLKKITCFSGRREKDIKIYMNNEISFNE